MQIYSNFKQVDQACVQILPKVLFADFHRFVCFYTGIDVCKIVIYSFSCFGMLLVSQGFLHSLA